VAGTAKFSAEAADEGSNESMSSEGVRQRLEIAIVAALAMFATPGNAEDDAYLKALANEAADLAVDPETRRANQDLAPSATAPKEGDGLEWSAERQGLGNQLPAGLDRQAFEEVLQVNFIGTYVFYQRLAEPSKAAVFKVYHESGDVVTVRNKIQSELKAK
jgi:NAD(P)-dependent dehydrogenase (short-subunit alcohol dehydrogenase family)